MRQQPNPPSRGKDEKQFLGSSDQASSSLVAASVRVGNGGSGTIVYAENGVAMVLTCQHVFEAMGATTTIRLPGGKTYKAELIANDKTHTDLAMYAMEIDDAPAVEVGDMPGAGATLTGIGYSDGTPRPRTGRYDGGRGDGPNEVGVSFMVNGGDSGGGVFADGKLVGVINKKRSDNGPGRGLVISQPACKRFVDACFPRLHDRFAKLKDRINPPPKMPPNDDFADAVAKLKEAEKKLQELRDELGKATPGAQGPQGPVGPAGKDGKDADIASLQKFLAAEIAKIKTIPGPQGPQGEPGPAGAPGKDADAALIASLQAQIDALRSQRFTAELYDQSGVLVQSVPFGTSEPLRLKLIPLK